jgi:hypothetical protein
MTTLGEALLRGDAMSRTEVEALLLRLASEHRTGTFEEKEPSTQRRRRRRLAAGSKTSIKQQRSATITPKLRQRVTGKKTTTKATTDSRQRQRDAAAGEAAQRGPATLRPADWEVLREGTQTLCDCVHYDTHVLVPTSPTASSIRPSTTDHRGLHSPPPSEPVCGLAATSSSTQSHPLCGVDLILM